MRIGVIFPQTEIGSDPSVIRDFAQTAEGLGYSHILAYDHVLGAVPEREPRLWGPYTHESAFHEPFTLFGYLAAVHGARGAGHGRHHPAPAPDRARGQAGRRGGHPLRRAAAAGRGHGLELRGVRRPQRALWEPRQAAGGADRGAAAAVGRARRRLRGRMAPHRPRGPETRCRAGASPSGSAASARPPSSAPRASATASSSAGARRTRSRRWRRSAATSRARGATPPHSASRPW